MTEVEWLACIHPGRMLEFLRRQAGERKSLAGERKLRLFAVACCRRIWHLLIDRRSRNAVDVVERFADGDASTHELLTAYYEANVALNASDPTDVALYGASQLASNIAYPAVLHGFHYTESAADAVADTVTDSSTNAVAFRVARRAELNAQAKLFREIFGNPFRPMTEHVLGSLQVTTLAQSIYADRAFDKMPELADALERAGCTDQEILTHCRGPGPHVRGCWVVDLILGKA